MGSCPFCLNGKSTPCFAIYENGYFCFTCNAKKSCDALEYAFRPSSTQAIALKVPNITCDFSPNVLQWLYKYYVFEDKIKKYGIYYIPEDGMVSESLLFGTYINKELVFWQRRFFPSKRFITGGDKNTPFLIRSEKDTHYSDTIVLVEDFISAIRVGEHANVLCLWGVHINYNMSKLLQNLDMNILVWLDPDEAGQTAAQELVSKLSKNMHYCSVYRAFAVREPRTISNLETVKQPKDYCDAEIASILENHNVKNN
jgi:DNA primase